LKNLYFNYIFQLLEELIKSHGDMSDYYRVPKLGQHYAQRWAKEDLENERVKGSSNPSDGIDGSDSNSAKMLRKAGEGLNTDDSPFGELTQRLVAGLMEENIMTPIEETLELGGKKGSVLNLKFLVGVSNL
jgi:transcriptional adapter 3